MRYSFYAAVVNKYLQFKGVTFDGIGYGGYILGLTKTPIHIFP